MQPFVLNTPAKPPSDDEKATTGGVAGDRQWDQGSSQTVGRLLRGVKKASKKYAIGRGRNKIR